MKSLLSGELREIFINYFKEKGHTLAASSSLVPAGDGSIMFTNAGMVQFKEYFTGQSESPFLRAVSVQKCMRAGGKHNDLENVGKTSRHHTFFEMLGNFSFGDYFKKEAIIFAFEFLKDVLEMDENRIYVSVHKDDDEGYSIWKNIIGFDENKIYKLGDDSNFWQMGETGPCGYSSEIFFDTGLSEAGHQDCDINCDCGRYLEIWNLVFMEFNKTKDIDIAKLPKPSIDTGMGLERVLRILQNVKSNYDTDVFIPYIKEIDNMTGRTYDGEDEDYNVAVRVISDHIRTSIFLAAESIFPSNEGRGYVLRRIIRRLIRYSLKLDMTLEKLIYLGNTVVIAMGEFYPEVRDGLTVFEKIISEEYDKFKDTISFGLKLLEEKISEIKAVKGKVIPGDFIFKLYDTNGFPVDLAVDIASENNLSLDLKKFDELMDVQRSGSKQKKEKFNILNIDLSFPKTNFTGYDTLNDKGKIIGFLNEAGELTDAVEDGDVCYAISDTTPFYPDGGGQTGDEGIIEWEGGNFRVSNIFKTKSGVILHYGRIFGKYNIPIIASFAVDKNARKKTAANHSATHLLQSALRTVLGDYVVQQGSSVDSERLRFDFSQTKAVSDSELRKIESLVNEYIFSDLEVKSVEQDVKTALNAGALHFFDEKYKDTVRVISMGDVSREFCGGTHVFRTGEIGFFKIMRESSVASGIRRIEAVTGYNYLNQLYIEEDNLYNIASLLGAPKSDIYNKIINLYYDYEYLKKENNDIKLKLNTFESERLIKGFKNIGHVHYLIYKFKDSSRDDLKELLNTLKSVHNFPKGDNVIIFISFINKDKLIYVCSTKGSVDASKIVGLLNKQVGGKGGGKRDFAQGGSADVSKLNDIEKVAEDLLIREILV